MNENETDGTRITLRDVFFYVWRKWRVVVLVVLSFALLLGVFRSVKLVLMINSDSYRAQAQELYEKAVNFYESETERLDKEIEGNEITLRNQNLYIEKSYLMSMDPSNCCVGSVDVQIACDALKGNISVIRSVLQSGIRTGKACEILAAKYGTESQYIEELIKVESNIEEKNTAQIDEKKGEDYLNGALIHVALIAADKNMAQEMLGNVVDYLNEICNQMNEEQTNLKLNLMYYNENYSIRKEDKLESYQMKMNDEVDGAVKSLEISKQSKAELEIPVYELMPLKEVFLSSIKYAILGGFVGFVICIFALVIMCLYSEKILSPSELRARTGLEVYTTPRGKGKKFGSLLDSKINSCELNGEIITANFLKRLLEIDKDVSEYYVWGERPVGALESIIPDVKNASIIDIDELDSWRAVNIISSEKSTKGQPLFILFADRESSYKEVNRKLDVIAKLTRKPPICILYI